MSISATLQLYSDTPTTDATGTLGAEVKAKAAQQMFQNIYTVLKLDCTFKRTCNANGLPQGNPTIDVIKVTIRAAKEKNATFHQWIMANPTDATHPNNGLLKSGEIKIYDSTGILSSSVQDAVGIDPLIDVEDISNIALNPLEETMNTGMDDATEYETRDLDKYDELSHKELLARARERGIQLNAGDTDDDIRDMLRAWDKLDEDDLPKVTVNKTEKKISDLTDEDCKKYAKDHDIEEPEDKTKSMKLKELQEYVKENKVTVKDGATEDEIRKAVKEDMENKYYKQQLINREKGLIAREKHYTKHLDDHARAPLQEEGEEYKKRTSSTVKGLGNAVMRKAFEVARSISFENAYCISLKETFVNAPDSTGKLDTKYPWVIELGIKPKKVTITGEQLVGQALGGQNSKAVFDGLYS